MSWNDDVPDTPQQRWEQLARTGELGREAWNQAMRAKFNREKHAILARRDQQDAEDADFHRIMRASGFNAGPTLQERLDDEEAAEWD